MGVLYGILVAGLGGASAGALSWPMKLMKKYDFEQCWFPGMLFGLFILPWAVTLIFCPNAIGAYRSVDPALIIRSNLFSLAWGIGNVLLGLSLVRIGASLSFAILSGVGIPLGVIVPMIFKGSGQFEDAADLNSPAGYTILAATALMLVGVVLVALAGFGRDKMLDKKTETSGGFLGGLIMCVVSGFCSVGPSFAFVYSQGPIRNAMVNRDGRSCFAEDDFLELALLADKLSRKSDLVSEFLVDEFSESTLTKLSAFALSDSGPEELKAALAQELNELIKGELICQEERFSSVNLSEETQTLLRQVREGEPVIRLNRLLLEDAYPQEIRKRDAGGWAPSIAVWALGMLLGGVVNLVYPAFLMTKRRSWHVIKESPKETGLSLIVGLNLFLAFALWFQGSLMLGPLGASVGFGIYFAMQILAAQGLGLISGEWRGVHGKPAIQMCAAVAILVLAAGIMAYASTLA